MEFISHFIAFIIGCCLSGVIGIFFAAIAFVYLSIRKRVYRKLVVLALFQPLLAFIYLCGSMFICGLFFPAQDDHIFGDIYEPLPNGYILTALDKMPYAGLIEKPIDQTPGISIEVEKLAQNGEVIYGSHSPVQIDFQYHDDCQFGCFIFDTRTGKIQEFKTKNELVQAAGQNVQLIENQSFRTQAKDYLFHQHVWDALYIGPPILSFIFVLALIIRAKPKTSN